jgi:hypothetical protein
VLLIGTGAVLRLIGLEELQLWRDETDWFDFPDGPGGLGRLRGYASAKAIEHTVGPVWPLIVVPFYRVFSHTAFVARLPSVISGTLAILFNALLAYRVIWLGRSRGAAVGAIVTAIVTAYTIVQIDYSQRIYPYIFVGAIASLIVLAHVEIVTALRAPALDAGRLVWLGTGYACVAGTALYVHLAPTILIGASAVALMPQLARALQRNPEARRLLTGICALTGLAVTLAWAGNMIHQSQGSYRYYLDSYYVPADASLVETARFLVARTYDLLSYHLNVFYEEELYWPRTVNLATVPLVGICLIGWWSAATGRHGAVARNLAVLFTVSLAMIGGLAWLRIYPIGGVRQSMFVVPMIFTLTGVGAAQLRTFRPGSAALGIVLAGYMITWPIYLPNFYRDRATVFDASAVVAAVQQAPGRYASGTERPRIYTLGGTPVVIGYRLRGQLDADIQELPVPLPDDTRQPFLLLSPHWPIENAIISPRPLIEELRRVGYQWRLLSSHEAKHAFDPDYVQTLYWPPNAFYLYEVFR